MVEACVLLVVVRMHRGEVADSCTEDKLVLVVVHHSEPSEVADEDTEVGVREEDTPVADAQGILVVVDPIHNQEAEPPFWKGYYLWQIGRAHV